MRTIGSKTVTAWAAVFWLAAAGLAANSQEGPGLPPEECVRLLRGARILQMRGDEAGELEKLRAAAAAFPDEIAPLYALLEHHRRHPLPEDEHRRHLDALARRLADPEKPLSPGMVSYLLRDPAVDDGTLETTLANVARRLAAPDAEPDPELLRVRAALEGRLGRDAEALSTLERLYQLTGAEDLVWPILDLCLDLERWAEAERLLAPRVEQAGNLLRVTYIHVLSRLGSTEELIRQLDKLAAEADVNVPGEATLVAGQIKEAAWRLRDLGQDAEAEQLFRRAHEVVADDTETRAVLLHLYGSEEDRQSHAAALAERWTGEDDPHALFDEGTQRLTAGDAAGAIDLLRRAAPLLPELEAAWYNLGLAAYRLEDWETVASAFARAAERNPERAQSFFYRGIALEKLDRCEEAVTALERAVELDPERALAHYYLASCHGRLGHREAAAAALARYRELEQGG